MTRHIRFEEVDNNQLSRLEELEGALEDIEDEEEEEVAEDEEEEDDDDEEEVDEDEDGDDVADVPFEDAIERLDVIAHCLTTENGEAIADVLADVADSLRTLTKILFTQLKRANDKK